MDGWEGRILQYSIEVFFLLSVFFCSECAECDDVK